MAPVYKLTYFNFRGLAETARLLLNYGQIEFEDVRITQAEWKDLKEKTPWGNVPILEHRGRVAGQSIAIARYLGKVVNLGGDDDWEDLEIDSIVDTVNDLRLKLLAIHYESDESKKKALLETAVKETLPFYLTRLDEVAKKNKGHLALGRLTWADFYFTATSQTIEYFGGANTLDNYPNLKAVREKVNNLPAIKKWIEVRPKTEF